MRKKIRNYTSQSKKVYFCVKFTQLKKMEKKTYTYPYPHPAVAADCVVFGFNGKTLEILLIRRGLEPFKDMWAFPGGFMRLEETAEECALRELSEETGLRVNVLKQLGAFTGIHRDPRERVVSIAFYALVQPSEVTGGDDASQARWFPLDEAPQLAFDHDYILRKATQQLRKDIHFEPVGFDLLDNGFTMSELQRLYECILGVRFDRRNFEKKMLQTGILEPLDDFSSDLFAEEDGTPYLPEPSSHSFGTGQEMKMMDINLLFESCRSSASAPAPAPKKKPGRKGRRFIFNKEKYNDFKQNNNFRPEF